jgi:hypothetical protein
VNYVTVRSARTIKRIRIRIRISKWTRRVKQTRHNQVGVPFVKNYAYDSPEFNANDGRLESTIARIAVRWIRQ